MSFQELTKGLTVRPKPVEACHEFIEWGERLSRSWFDCSTSSQLTTNDPKRNEVFTPSQRFDFNSVPESKRLGLVE